MPGTISFDGLATGMNTTELVEKLIQVESRPKILKEAEKTRLENQRTAWQEINTRLLAVKLAASDLSRLATWNTQAVKSSNEAVLTATASLGAPQGIYTVNVEALARAHQIATPTDPAAGDYGYASAESVFGTGNLTLTVAGTDHSFTLDETNNTLGGVAKTINDARIGVTASVVHNGSGYQLLLSANKTGVANALSVDASGVAGGEKTLPGVGSWAEVQAAQDALVSLGSGAGKISVTSASNTVSTLIQGLTLNLQSSSPGTEVTVTVSRDGAGLAEQVQTFVDAYNEAATYIATQFSYDAEQNVAGILMGDSTLLTVQHSLGRMLTRSIGAGTDYTVLSSVGLKLSDSGSLTFDAAKFGEAVQDDFDGVMRLFRTAGDSSHAKISFVHATSRTQEGTYTVDVTAPATKAQVAGGAAPSLAVTDLNDELTLAIDGGAAVTVALTQKTYASTEELAAELQSKIGDASGKSVTVSVDASGNLFIQSVKYGSASQVSITGGDGMADLGFSAESSTGTDVQGTINGEPATGTGQILKGNGGNANTDGLQVLVQLDAPGTATLSVVKGAFSLFDEYLSDLTAPATGTLERREESLSSSIQSLSTRIAEMEERLEAKRESLTARFLRMEESVSSFNTQGNYLANALSGLSKNWQWNS